MQNTDQTLSLARLPRNKPTGFSYIPTPDQTTDLAQILGVEELRKLRFTGELSPLGKQDWHLSGELGATVVQACVLTLAPVTTRLDEVVTRHYSADVVFTQDEVETEMPTDVDQEPVPSEINLHDVLAEALSLAIPPYPRAKGAEGAEMRATPPGVTPLRDEDTHAFAALSALRDKMKGE